MARLGLAALIAAALAALATAPAASAACPNEAIREAQRSEALPAGTTYLPGCMALEMVSPPVKDQQSAFSATFSPDGNRVRFRAASALGGTPGMQGLIDSYVATRTASGWATSPTSPPAGAAIAGGSSEKGGPIAFSPDLSRWDLLGATQAQTQAGSGQIFRGGLGGLFEPLSPLLVPIDNSGNTRLRYDTFGAESTGSSASRSTTVFSPYLKSTAFLAGDPVSNEGETAADNNNYVAARDAAGEPSLELLTRDREGRVFGGRCGAHLGGGNSGYRGSGRINQGAISPDGARIYLTTRPAQPWDSETHEGPVCDPANPLRILRRTETPEGPLIEPLVEGESEAEWEEAGSDNYQGASVDGSKVYFTTTRKLSSSDKDPSATGCSSYLGESEGCDLYLYDYSKSPSHRLVDVSAGDATDPTRGEGAGVLSSIVAVSGDGTRAYFAAQGVLTTKHNPEGAEAVAGQPNLYTYDARTGALSFIGTLSPEDKGSLWGTEQSFVGGAYAVPSIGESEAQGGDGHILLFASHASLTAGDTDGGYSDLFRYDAEAGTLQRISKAAPGGRESPPADVEVNPNDTAPNGNPFEQGRWVSEDGDTVAFATAEPLAPGDEDGVANPYLWKEGKLVRLPSAFASLPAVSPSGQEAGFTSEDRLLPQDRDDALDVYVLRAGGGFPLPSEPAPCDPLSEGSCSQGASTAPTAPAPATSAFSGAGNFKPPHRCRRGKVRRRGRCVRRRRRKGHRHHSHRGKRRHASRHRGKGGHRRHGKRGHGKQNHHGRRGGRK